MLFSRASLVSALALVATATAQTSLSPAQESKVVNDLSNYLASVVKDPAYTSNALVVATAIPESVIDQLQADPTAFLSSVASATPDWFKNLPSSIQSYYSSIGAVEASIISKDTKGPAPTHGPMLKIVAGVGAVAGAVAVAL